MSRDFNGFGQNRPLHIKISVVSCAHSPFYQRQGFTADLNAGDAPRVYAAANIDITGAGGQHGAVGVAGDKGVVTELCPFAQSPLGALLGAVVFGGAGWI